MTQLSWITYIMLILASYRLTHLIVFDKITEFIRKPFVKKVKVETVDGTKSKEVPTSLFVIYLNVIGVPVYGAPFSLAEDICFFQKWHLC